MKKIFSRIMAIAVTVLLIPCTGLLTNVTAFAAETEDVTAVTLEAEGNDFEALGLVEGGNEEEPTDPVPTDPDPEPEPQNPTGNFYLTKTDSNGTALANVQFLITNSTTNESFTITTDANGYYSTVDANNPLACGDYTIEEVHGSSNRGLTMMNKSFTIAENDLLDLSMVDTEPEFSLSGNASNSATGLKTAKATDTELVLSDVLTLNNVYLWDSATINVWAVDKSTGVMVTDATGRSINMSEQIDFDYTPDFPGTAVTINFDFDFSNLVGKEIVFYSEVTVTDRAGVSRIVCENKNINNADETIKFDEAEKEKKEETVKPEDDKKDDKKPENKEPYNEERKENNRSENKKINNNKANRDEFNKVAKIVAVNDAPSVLVETKDNTKDTKTVPKTGDNSNAMTYMLLAVGAGIVLVAGGVVKRRKKTN